MAQFVGTWKNDCSSYKNYEEYCRTAGYPEELSAKIKNDENTAEFKRNGDKWTCHYKGSVGPEKTYEFESGKEIEIEFLGKKVKCTITFDSDSKMSEVEMSEFTGFKPVKITREVKGDTMYCVHTLEDGTNMSFNLKRV